MCAPCTLAPAPWPLQPAPWPQVDDYKSIRNKAVLASRAAPLFRRYFAADSKARVVIDPEIVAKIESELENPKASTFAVAQVGRHVWVLCTHRL